MTNHKNILEPKQVKNKTDHLQEIGNRIVQR